MEKFYNVALPVSVEILFTYRLPVHFSGEDIIGKRVLVPFRNRLETGVVVGHSEKADVKRIKEISEIIDPEPVVSKKMLEFCKWISNYYLASLGETLRLALPPGNTYKSIKRVRLVREITDNFISKVSKNAPKRAEILNVLKDQKDFIGIKTLANKVGTSNINDQLQVLYDKELIELDETISTKASDKYQKALKLNETFSDDDLKEIINDIQKQAPKQALLLSYLRHNKLKEIFLSELNDKFKTGYSIYESLEKKGIIEVFEKRKDRSEMINEQKLSKGNEIKLSLTKKQQRIERSISGSILRGKPETFLIHGITGSGKTLIYLHLIRQVISGGRSVLIMVPEISLTPQLIDRFESVFPGEIAVVHSKMSAGERYDSWRNIKNKSAKIVIGARSALFAPLWNLGLIIVDEEHDQSFKQEAPSPRYNGRDCAVVRGKMENVPVVLGSATPSIESYYNAKTGKYKYYKLNERADNAKLPEIKIIDMKTAYKEGQVKGKFTKLLLSEISSRVEKGEGTILLQNRRGFSTMLYCSDCGFVPMCVNCDITMTYHKHSDQLRCHYCGYTVNKYEVCPECGSSDLKTVGFGTQRIEKELEELLLETGLKTNIERFDLDTTSGKDGHRKILTRFAHGETDILVGTQMVAKGIDFDRVTLVGILSADSQLFIPEFRSSEKTFSLLTQVAGRAGRSASRRGEVIIQTLDPENPAISYTIKNDYEKFAKEELRIRKNAKYPPFYRFVLIEFRSQNEHLCDEHSKIFYNILPNNISSFEALGPSRPEIARLRNNFRRIIIVKNDKNIDKSGNVLRSILRQAVDIYNKKYHTSKVYYKIDIDSYSSV